MSATVSFRVALAITYVGIIALAINTYQSAIQADQQGLDGAKTGWLGGWWLSALVVLAVIAIGLHVVLAKRGDTPS